MNELHGILTSYKMRKDQDNPIMREETFKASKKIKKKDKQKEKSYCSCSDDSEEHEEVANFIKRLKTGTKKYKGKVLLIFFNCDGVGHFTNNNLIRKRKEMKKNMTLKRKNKFKMVEEIKKSFSRNVFAPRKTVPHQTKMKSVIVIHKWYY
jgi:hypothetical protein